MKILVVEPHADDAFLSLGAHIADLWAGKGCEITILTVYNGARRAGEAKAYAESVGAVSETLGLAESPMNEPGTVRPIPELRAWLTDRQAEFDRIVFPLGLQHPDHRRVAASRPSGAWRYLDTPYQMKQKCREQLLERAEGLAVASILFPGKTKWKRQTIFKSQSRFFYYNKLDERRLPEILLQPERE